jgi:6-phosphofructokinase 2
MTHFAVRTLTLNPSIDVSSDTEKVAPERKVRTCNERIDPGGGGINVARVLHRLGTTVEAVFLAGGATGGSLEELLKRAGLARRLVPIADDTRTSLTVHEHSTGKEYRFVPEGPTISASEVAACSEAIAAASCDYFVASGSLPPGVPDDFYAAVGTRTRGDGARFVLDTSGAELDAALAAGGIFLLKSSGEELDAGAAGDIVRSGKAEQVALTCGREGALLINAEGTFALSSLRIETISTVGAGDSFLAGMVHGLAAGLAPTEAFRIAVAAGAAATLSPGTDLAYPENVWRLLDEVPEPRRIG